VHTLGVAEQNKSAALPASGGTAAAVGLRAVALAEAAKGLLVLLIGFGALSLLHSDVQSIAEELVRHFHLNPARRYPRIFLHLAQEATPSHLFLLAFGAAVYALMRFIEAYGLWRQRHWAEWFGIISSAIYIPVEVRAILKHVHWPEVALLTVNIAILLCLGRALIRVKGGGP
jgi:uncharacterized membrane protein (DUF2068 family)